MAQVLQDKDQSLRATLSERERALRELTIANETLASAGGERAHLRGVRRQLKTLDVHALAIAGLREPGRSLAGAHVGVVYLLDGANRLVPVHATALDGRAVDQNHFGADGLARTTMGRREPLLLTGAELGRVPPKLDLGVAVATVCWVLAQPIAVENEEAGAVLLGGVMALAPEQKELVGDAARQLAVGLHNACGRIRAACARRA